MKKVKSFEQWMKEVDNHIVKKCGFYSEMLPDMPYYDWYTAKYSPGKAASTAIELVKSGAMW